MHIGLTGGIGPAATDFYYRGLIDRDAATGVPLDAISPTRIPFAKPRVSRA
jgi:hypothetical protein